MRDYKTIQLSYLRTTIDFKVILFEPRAKLAVKEHHRNQ